MNLLLYSDLVPWYHLLDPLEDHAGEAESYLQAFARHVTPQDKTLLELGSGAGNNASFLKQRFTMTLTDLSDAMLELSRRTNPECEHFQGDMRTIRLGRTFDAVFIHDAIDYLTTEADLRACFETAFVHTRPGGTVVIAPDSFKDTFQESTELFEGDDGERALRCIEWDWDPDPNDNTHTTEYAFLLRHGTEMKAVHDRHVAGLFPRSTWRRLLEETGFEVDVAPRLIDDGTFDEIFVCRRR